MTDVTTLLAGIKTRASETTSLGEWETTRANDVVIYAPNGFGANHLVAHASDKADAAFIAAARTDVPRLVAAIDAVTALHKPVEVYEIDPMNGTWIYDGDEQRVMATLCRECTGDSVLESIGDCEYDETDYHDETPYPCPTITAVTAALGGGE